MVRRNSWPYWREMPNAVYSMDSSQRNLSTTPSGRGGKEREVPRRFKRTERTLHREMSSPGSDNESQKSFQIPITMESHGFTSEDVGMEEYSQKTDREIRTKKSAIVWEATYSPGADHTGPFRTIFCTRELETPISRMWFGHKFCHM